MVTTCDHLRLLAGRELKHEVPRKPLRIALDGLIERLGRHPVEHGQIGIDDDLVLAHDEDAALDARQHHGCLGGSLACCAHLAPPRRLLLRVLGLA